MADRRPLVDVSGSTQEMPADDRVPAACLPAVTVYSDLGNLFTTGQFARGTVNASFTGFTVSNPTAGASALAQYRLTNDGGTGAGRGAVLFLCSTAFTAPFPATLGLVNFENGPILFATNGLYRGGFASTGEFQLMATTSTQVRPQAGLVGAWITSTDSTRTGRLSVGAYTTTTFQEAIRIDANTGGVRIGFFGAAAAAKPTVTGSRMSGAALVSLLSALSSLGLITDSTSS